MTDPEAHSSGLSGGCHGVAHAPGVFGPSGSVCRTRRMLPAVLLVLGAAALVAVSMLHEQAASTVLVVPPRLKALRARLQRVEDNLMGMRGPAALSLAEKAESLQTVINNEKAVELRTKVATSSGPATLQTLTSVKSTPVEVRMLLPGQKLPKGAKLLPPGAVQVPAARKVPIVSHVSSAAQKLAANLARYQHGTRRMQGPQTRTVQGPAHAVRREAKRPTKASKINPWLVVPSDPIVHKAKAKALAAGTTARRPGVRARLDDGKTTFREGKQILDEGNRILAERFASPSKGSRVEVRMLLPGQKLPKGAKLLPPRAVAKLQRNQGLVQVQTLDDEPAADAGGEGSAAEGEAEEEAEEAPPEEPVEEPVGDTGMTPSELKAFADSEKSKAKFLLGQAEGEREGAMVELEDSRRMIARGWDKHKKADAMRDAAGRHLFNATMLHSTYERELAAAKAEKDGGLAQKLEDIATRFEEDAAEKHSKYEEALGGAASLDLIPYGMDTGVDTAASDEQGEAGASGETEASGE